LSHGILNEVYYPRVDHACTRDLGFIVTDGQSYFSEEKRDTQSVTSQVEPGVPAYRIRNTAIDGRYRIEKEVLTDPWRDVVLQRVRLVPLIGTLADFRLFALLAPHLANRGSENTAWVGHYKGVPVLLAERDHHALALASTAPWLARSVGFVGFSDGWQQLQADKRLERTYPRAENGNVAVTGEIDLEATNGAFVLALGFGPTAMEAGQHALISLLEDFDQTHCQSAGSLGRRARLLSVHASDRSCSAPCGRGIGRGKANVTAAVYLRETADAWNASIERWLYVTGTELAIAHGVDGYYVRVAEPDRADAASPCHGFVPIKNRPPDQSTAPAALMVSLDALAFVRFGLRAADDPRVLNTIKVIDTTLRVETPRGPVWHRYQGDGYGEHADGGPFNGAGIGRVWPLLTGERAHYELAAGRIDVAEQLARTMEALAGESGLLPEQVWDSADIPGRELLIGHASGSASPLVWAHAEYLKLCRSIRGREVFDRPADR
jgi:GH15 family glucan-1,4-alpha-glucosidase